MIKQKRKIMKTTTMTQNIFRSLLFGLSIMLLLSLVLICSSCGEKTDPYPPLREISVEIYTEGTFELSNDQGYYKDGPINGFDSLTVTTEHIEKGQHWTLVLHKTTPKDSTIILVNRIGTTVTQDHSGDTLKTYSFKIES